MTAAGSQVLDSKVLTNLIQILPINLPVDVSVRRIEWDNAQKKWRATLKNRTDFYVKMGVQGYIRPPGTQDLGTPAGGVVIMISPQSQATTKWISAPATATPGNYLDVHIWYSSGCSQDRDVKKCGFEWKWSTLIPNSKDFY